MLCIFLLQCAIRRPQSLTLFDVVRYSQTPSNRESWGGLSQANLSSIAVQLSDNISEIWLSTYLILCRGEIAIIQVFDEDKIAITSLLMKKTLSGHFLFRLQQLPCFSIEYSRLTMLLSTLLWYVDFVLRRRLLFSQLELSHRRLPNIWLAGERSDPNGTINTQAFGELKKATRPGRRFLIAPAPISSLFLFPCMPLLRCVPNQNHDATQVAYFINLLFWE